MKISQLQGTPWHYEQRKRTCQDGSKYCIYNRNICVCTHSRFHYQKCVGKGLCDDFESKSGTPKLLNTKIYSGNLAKNKINVHKSDLKNCEIQKEPTKMSKINKTSKESKEDKFLRVSKGRIDKVEEAIRNLENLADKNSYSYTDEQVEKMFSYLEGLLNNVKDKFKNNKSGGGFSWS